MIEQRRPKYRIYIDEVGNNDLSFSDDFNHRFLSLTGIIFNIEYMKNTVAPIIDKLKYSFFPNHHPDEPIILHRKEMINFKYPFHILKNDEIRNRFDNILLEIINKLEYSIISVIIDKKAHNEKYKVEKKSELFSNKINEIIKNKYYKGKNGKLEGYGIKLLP